MGKLKKQQNSEIYADFRFSISFFNKRQNVQESIIKLTKCVINANISSKLRNVKFLMKKELKINLPFSIINIIEDLTKEILQYH